MNQNADNRNAVGRVPSHGAAPKGRNNPDAGSGDPAYNATVLPVSPPTEPPPRRLRRLHRIWRDRAGNISYLLTICVDGRGRILDNDIIFKRLVAFLLDSPARYHWFGRRFVAMPDHIHLIAHQGRQAVRLGEWIKALKAVVGGLKPRMGAHGLPVGPEFSPGSHKFTRVKRAWWWQDRFHDHKFRTPEGESRKWEYVCLNPVRAHLAQLPEEWPFGGEIFYDEAGGPRLVRGTPPLLETGLLIEESETPPEGTRPAT